MWWQAPEMKTYVKLMGKAQRQALFCITEALRSTPIKLSKPYWQSNT